MRLFGLPAMIALSQLAAFTLAIPVDPASLVARSQLRDDAQTFVAGTLFDPRSKVPESLEARVGNQPVIWRAPGSQTYVAITPIYAIAGNAIVNMLDAAALHVYARISNMGDGPISGGNFGWNGNNGLILNAWSANNHQTTYGVLGAAIKALTSYFDAHEYGRAIFLIYDGENQVGEGIIG